MTALEYLEKIDDTLSHWEDYFKGDEGVDVTEARANLDNVRKELTLTLDNDRYVIEERNRFFWEIWEKRNKLPQN
jgi:hypothetical protein